MCSKTMTEKYLIHLSQLMSSLNGKSVLFKESPRQIGARRRISLNSRLAWSTSLFQDNQGYIEKPCPEKKKKKLRHASTKSISLG